MTNTWTFLKRSALLCATTLGLVQAAHAVLPIQHWQQASGARVYLVEAHNIPMVDVQIDLDAGSRRDPADKPGLASAAAGQLASGIRALPGAQGPYAKALDENQLGEAWADLGASFGASASGDRLSFSLRSLSDADLLDKAARLAARQMAHPAYPQGVWLRDRDKLAAAIRESLTRPGTVAQNRFAEAVYGGHPYSWRSTPGSLQRIGVADLQRWHAQALRPCRAVVSVVGDLNREQADALVTRLLAHWPQGRCEALPAVAEVPELNAAQDLRLPFDSAQAHVLIGQPGHKRNDPDFFALLLGNHILGGGGFTSRLTEQVREKRGLSYSVYSYFSPALHAGAFTVGLQTRPDQAAQAVEVARQVVKDFVEQGPTEAELQAAKDNLIGGFALRIDSNRKLLDNVANIAWNQLPLDYLDRWTENMAKVTTADVRRAFARVLQPGRMVTVVVGGTPL
ncbi:MAG: insulinase family protein [Limnohabitans sp.]|jgi:zinc protease|nr:MAG: insulinase family protein [Limnohabitans sp.]